MSTIVAPTTMHVSQFGARVSCALGIAAQPEYDGEPLHVYDHGGQLYCLLDTEHGTIRVAITDNSAVLELYIPDAIMANLAGVLPYPGHQFGVTGWHEGKEQVVSFRSPEDHDTSAMLLEVLLKDLEPAFGTATWHLMFAPYERGTGLGCEDLVWHRSLRGYVLK